MKHTYPSLAKARLISSRLGTLVLLFQRAPMVRMFFPEARLLAGAGLGEITSWTIATVVGLGAYDSVAGATTLKQLIPKANLSTVPAKVGSKLSFVFQITGTDSAPKTWQIIGALPAGLTHTNSVGKTIDSITGVPTQSGKFRITVKAWEFPRNRGKVYAKTFVIKVAPASITFNGTP